MRIYHGKILSLDKNNTIYNYLVEDKGRIVYLGNSLPIEYANHNSPLELGNRVLLPSFGDGHMHFSNWALIAVSYFDVRDARDIREIQEIIQKYMTQNKKLKAIIAFGVSKHSVKEKRLIERQELDEVCPDMPLIIICYDGHSAVCNTKMQEKFPDKVKNLRGFIEDKGHLFSEAYLAGTDYAASLVPSLDLVKSIVKSFDLLAEKGIGLIHATEGIGFPKDLDITLVSLISKARARHNDFQTRMLFQTMDLKKVLKRKLPRIGGCFATALDGCFGACDAALKEPYTNDPENKGILFYTDEEVQTFTKGANREGLQIQMHCIGDAAVQQAIDALKAALQDFPREDHRHTIIHACLISPENLKTCAEYGIGITLQPGFLISPLEPIEYLHDVLGSRIDISSPLRDIIDAGIHLNGGSDGPVTHPDPITAMFGACNHPYDPKQSVTIQEALKMNTYEIAWTSFDENERGSLETSKIADMVILNKNPLTMDPKNLLQLKVERLYLSGKKYVPGMSIGKMLRKSMFGKKIKI
ncbi:MAG: amidohydrolase family protein [Desulfobacula sp.]|nr:amidohydrolase family protein [Desulfobacula sp.]